MRRSWILSLIALAFAIGFVLGLLAYHGILPTSQTDSSYLRVHFINVGQGDSILVETKGHTMLVDGGEEFAGPRIEQYLEKNNVETLDYVIASHPHEDHVGGLAHIIKSLKVGMVYDTGLAHPSPGYVAFLQAVKDRSIPYNLARAGLEFQLDPQVNVKLLAPFEELIENPNVNLNNKSAVVLVSIGNISVLLTGDIEKETEEQLLRIYPDLRATILKVAHHGSRTSTSSTFLSAIRPEIAVISVGAYNEYGHPHLETLERLRAHRVKTLRTDVSGNIIIFTDGQTYTVNASS